MAKDLYYLELEKNHKRNTFFNTLDAIFFQIGFVCFVPAVIIVAYLKHFTENELILNLPVFIANFCMCLGPLVMSFYSGRVKRKKKIMMVTSLWHRIMWIPVILTVYFFSDSKEWLIPVFMVTYLVFYIVWGSSVLFWQEMIGRSLLPEKLGSAMGLRESVSRIIGFVASLGVMLVLGRVPFPNNFLILFCTSFVFWMASLMSVNQMKEAPYEEAVKEKTKGHLQNLMALPVKDRPFRWFIIFILFLYGFLFVGGLYTVVGIERFKDIIQPDRLTGIMNIMTTLASCIFAFTAGKVCERAGKFWGFFIYTIINILLPVCMNFCYNYYIYLGLMFFSGVVNTIWIIEFTTLMSFSAPERRHEYIAVLSFVKLIPIVVYTNLGGLLASMFSHGAVFITSSMFSVAALLILIFKLRPIWEK